MPREPRQRQAYRLYRPRAADGEKLASWRPCVKWPLSGAATDGPGAPILKPYLMVPPVLPAYVFGERPTALAPRRRRRDGRRADAARHVLCRRIRRGGAVRLF